MYIKIITVRHGVDGQGEGEVFATARLRQHARLMVGKGLVQVAGVEEVYGGQARRCPRRPGTPLASRAHAKIG